MRNWNRARDYVRKYGTGMKEAKELVHDAKEHTGHSLDSNRSNAPFEFVGQCYTNLTH